MAQGGIYAGCGNRETRMCISVTGDGWWLEWKLNVVYEMGRGY